MTLILLSLLAVAPDGGFTLVFVGGAAGDEAAPALARLPERLEQLDPESGLVVFTGNYASGELPQKDDPRRAELEQQVAAHVTATRAFVERGGRVYYLAGDRDFGPCSGTKAVRRLRSFLNHAYGADEEDKKLDVMPKAGCGDPVVLELTDDVGLMLLDSQWWLRGWDDDPESNLGCELQSRDTLEEHVREAFNDHRTRRLIVASHHPLLSYGPYGGAFSTPADLGKQGDDLVTMLVRGAGLAPQHQNHPRARAYAEMLLKDAERFGSFLFVSGHDESLQYLKLEKQTQLIAGSAGRNPTPVGGAREGELSVSTPGWAEVVITPTSGTVQFFGASNGRPLLFEASVPVEPTWTVPEAPPAPLPKSPVVATYALGKTSAMSGISKVFLGGFYNDAYRLDLEWPVLDLGTEQGGLTPEETGGGLQTNALKLKDPQGGGWSIRPITKDSKRLMAGTTGTARDQKKSLSRFFTTMQPEAALSVARLAEAVHVLHAEPQLMYLPDQPALGRFRGYLGDEVVLLERRASSPDEGTLPETLAGPPPATGKTKFKDTGEMLQKILDDPATHRIDEEAMLRARLLDVFIADWDRHEGQWRFAETRDEAGVAHYQPIPRDRDQAFGNYDAFLLRIAQTGSPVLRKLNPFSGSYSDVTWLTHSSRHFDPVLLGRLDRKRWLAVAAQMQADLTDDVIDEALKLWHPDAYELDGKRIAEALKLRRDALPKVASEYYDQLARNAEVLGSQHDDLIELWFNDDGTVRVKAGAREEGEAWLDRVYEPEHTEELRIYALGGDDVLRVHGQPHREILIRFVGGAGDDVVTSAGGHVTASAIRLYDAEDGARIDSTIDVEDERSSVPNDNQYDRNENHEPDALTFVPGLRANPDDGVMLGGDLVFVAQGYKKAPFAARHVLSARFATDTLAASLEYGAVFRKTIGRLDQNIDVVLRAPTSVRNFFGISNEFRGDLPLDYFRVRTGWYEGRYGLSLASTDARLRIGAQLVGQAVSIEGTVGRYVNATPEGRDAIGTRFFTGARLYALATTFDDLTLPTRGVGLSVSVESRADLLRLSSTPVSTSYKAVAAAAVPFDRTHRVVLLSKLSLEGIVGAHPFYFSPTLGRGELRAYHLQQLTGDVAFAQTTDLRVEVLRHSAPGIIGVNLSVDHGRVFAPQISSRTWHLSLGGSVWWAIMDTMAVSAGYYRSLAGGDSFMVMFGPLFVPTAI